MRPDVSGSDLHLGVFGNTEDVLRKEIQRRRFVGATEGNF